jgi:hypothetical protein
VPRTHYSTLISFHDGVPAEAHVNSPAKLFVEKLPAGQPDFPNWEGKWAIFRERNLKKRVDTMAEDLKTFVVETKRLFGC